MSLLRYHIDHRETHIKGTGMKCKFSAPQMAQGTNKWKHFEMQSGQSGSQYVPPFQQSVPRSRSCRPLRCCRTPPHVLCGGRRRLFARSFQSRQNKMSQRVWFYFLHVAFNTSPSHSRRQPPITIRFKSNIAFHSL